MPDLQANPSKPIRDAIAKRQEERDAANPTPHVGDAHDALDELHEDIDAIDAAFGKVPPLVPAVEQDPPAEPPPADTDAEVDDEPSKRELSGKRVVLVRDTQGAPEWHLLVDGGDPDKPQLYEGDRDSAPRAALEDPRNEDLAQAATATPLRFKLVAIPASSWYPAAAKPRTIKTTWELVR